MNDKITLEVKLDEAKEKHLLSVIASPQEIGEFEKKHGVEVGEDPVIGGIQVIVLNETI